MKTRDDADVRKINEIANDAIRRYGSELENNLLEERETTPRPSKPQKSDPPGAKKRKVVKLEKDGEREQQHLEANFPRKLPSAETENRQRVTSSPLSSPNSPLSSQASIPVVAPARLSSLSNRRITDVIGPTAT